MQDSEDVTKRFSNRVDDYVKYRPSYPLAMLDFMMTKFGLSKTTVVADVGSGTGIFSELLLGCGATVYGVEPNAQMRAAAEAMLRGAERFRSIDRSAEQTGLPDSSVDIVTAATAFHWFNAELVRAEWKRILRPHGIVFLIWNVRRASSPFLGDYEKMLHRFGNDYDKVKHRGTEDWSAVAAFFSPNNYQSIVFPNEQLFDFDGLKGRLLSSSYSPVKGHPLHEPMLTELRRLFELYQIDGKVKFEYDTQAYFGKL